MTIARLKITLEGIQPVVSRSLEVPIDIRLDRLHLVIQAAMGWENYHLYEFMTGDMRWSLPDPDFDTDALPVAKARLADVMDAAGTDPIRYIYDFGDHWVHLIDSELIGDPMPGNLYPRLIEITGRCPPEDVGGLPGYEHFLGVIGVPLRDDGPSRPRWRALHPSPLPAARGALPREDDPDPCHGRLCRGRPRRDRRRAAHVEGLLQPRRRQFPAALAAGPRQ